MRSSTRLLSFFLLACVLAVTTVICIYTLRTLEPSAAVIGSLAGVLTALVLNGIVAMTSRTPVTTQAHCAAEEEHHEDHG